MNLNFDSTVGGWVIDSAGGVADDGGKGWGAVDIRKGLLRGFILIFFSL